jgi:hypothetical protein
MESIKPLSNVVTLGASANNIYLSKVIRVNNANSTVAALLTITDVDNGNANTQCIVGPLDKIAVLKTANSTLISNLTSLVFASAVGLG